MKKIILFGVIITSLMVMLPYHVSALTVDKNELTIANGNSNELTLTTSSEEEITQITFNLVFSTYDVVASFNPDASLTNINSSGSTYTINFDEPVTGDINLGTIKITVKQNPTGTSGGISLYGATATTTSGTKISLTPQTINVIIGEETEGELVNNKSEDQKTTDQDTEDNEKTTPSTNTSDQSITSSHLLKEIESKLVKINLKDNKFEYDVKISSDIEELDLKPIAIDSTYQVEISSQKITELKDNQIIITVRSSDQEQTYKINVKQLTVDQSKTEVDYSYKKTWLIIIGIFSIILIIGIVLSKRK